MRAVRHTDNGIEVVDVPRPDADHGRVRVHVRGAGICGSDLHMLTWGPMPVTLGHEVAGHLDDGTPVAVWPLVPCGACDRCAAGEVTQCRSAIPRSYGLGRDGGMADDVVVDAAGTDSALATCFKLLRPGGTVALVASYWEPVRFPQFFSIKEPVVIGSNMHGHDESGRDMDAAARVLADFPELASALVTHRFPLDRATEAFSVAADRAAGSIKVLLEP